jgi:hypothetical protein
MASALIRLYPRAWRQRYGPEMRELLAAKRVSLRTIADLLAGAIDARFNSQLKPAEQTGPDAGIKKMVKAFRCAPEGVSIRDQWRSAAWLVGGSAVLTVFGLLLRMQLGPNSLSEGLLYSAFPASLSLSSECTYLRRYSATARTVMAAGGAVFIVLVIWGAVALSNVI